MDEDADKIKQFPSPEGLQEKRVVRDHLLRVVEVIERLQRNPGNSDGRPPVTMEDQLAFMDLKTDIRFFLEGLMQRPYDMKFDTDLGVLNGKIGMSNLVQYLSDDEIQHLGWDDAGAHTA